MNHITRSQADVDPQVMNPEATMHVSSGPSFEKTRSNAHYNVVELAWVMLNK